MEPTESAAHHHAHSEPSAEGPSKPLTLSKMLAIVKCNPLTIEFPGSMNTLGSPENPSLKASLTAIGPLSSSSLLCVEGCLG
jgi:hypothetical protein